MHDRTARRIASGVALLAGLAAGTTQAATWSDTFLGYRYGTQFTEPGNPNDVEKHILQFTHVSGYSLGQNFLNLDVLQSDDADPASGGESGATEAYLTYRHQLHFGKLFDEPLAFGPVKDVGLTGGFDLNTKNTEFAPRKRMLVVGPTLKFDLPKGFLDLSLFYAHEWNHCGAGFCEVNEIEFAPYYQINLAWGLPLELGALPLKFQGFYNFNHEKGDDYQGNATESEQLLRTALMLDVGRLAWGEENQLWAGIGYEYWRNKFGNHDKPGVDTDAPTLQVEWHF
ncbi:outer membrane protein OmpK [Billgrantia saliphila]|uniref:outer membrane protein OmpK n=1 Tax=Billgrantia saliphila TaxID=1848458 RepID=UPI000CE38138|nr:outer membrane protein OmpK [Halomonas saliphila]